MRKFNWFEWTDDPVYGIGNIDFICVLVIIVITICLL